MKKVAFLVLASLCLASSIVRASEQQAFTTALPDGSQLSLTLPAEWQAVAEEAGPAVNLRLTPTSSGDFLVLITFIPIMPGSEIASVEDVRRLVLYTGNEKLPTALQDRIELIEISAGDTIGYLYHLTDRNPEKGPGDYREAHQGALFLDPYVASATILTHTDDTSTPDLARQVLASARVVSSD